MTTVACGMPVPPSTPVRQRRVSRQVMVGTVPVGGGAPVSVQSMTTTPATDVDATLQQIAELTAAGCEIVRVAVPSQDDADALPAIGTDAGCATVRVNPSNIRKFDDQVRQIARAAAAAGVPIRIGMNAESLDPTVAAEHGRACPAALVSSALWECSLFEEHGFRDSRSRSSITSRCGGRGRGDRRGPQQELGRRASMLSTHRGRALRLPQAPRVTEAGPLLQGSVKSAVAFGIGDRRHYLYLAVRPTR